MRGGSVGVLFSRFSYRESGMWKMGKIPDSPQRTNILSLKEIFHFFWGFTQALAYKDVSQTGMDGYTL